MISKSIHTSHGLVLWNDVNKVGWNYSYFEKTMGCAGYFGGNGVQFEKGITGNNWSFNGY